MLPYKTKMEKDQSRNGQLLHNLGNIKFGKLKLTLTSIVPWYRLVIDIKRVSTSFNCGFDSIMILSTSL